MWTLIREIDTMIGNVMDMSEDDVREFVLTLIFGAMCVLDRTRFKLW